MLIVHVHHARKNDGELLKKKRDGGDRYFILLLYMLGRGGIKYPRSPRFGCELLKFSIKHYYY